MTTYILHGGYTGAKNEMNRSFYEVLTREVPDGGMVLCIYFARADDDVPTLFAEDKQRILMHTKTKNLSVLCATRDNFEQQVRDANALYMRGGNTDNLLAALRQFPDFARLVRGKTVAGSSAGAYAIARYSVGHSVSYVREGLGLAPLRVVCHYESPMGAPNSISLETLRNTAPELELLLLRDHEWVTRDVHD